MQKYKKYPSYKPTGIEWIGEIPEGWKEKRLKYSAKYNMRTLIDNTTNPNLEIEYLDIGNVDSEGNILKIENMFFRDAPSRARRIVRNSNTIISTVRTYLKAIAYLESITDNFIVSTGFAVIDCYDNSNPKYFYYLFRSHYFIEQVMKNSKGVGYPAITLSHSPSNLIDIPLPLPPLPEQQAIASFLDRETARINGIIEKQTRLIELLKEKRAALITHAVTKGLDPNAKMKNSGVEWIGEMPEGWEVNKIKFMIKKSLGGGTPNTSNPSYWNGEIPWVSPKDMKVVIINESEEYITARGVYESTVNMIPANSLLCVFRSGILKHTFPIAINDIPVTLNQDMKALIPVNKTFSAYLFWLFTGFNKIILNLCVKVIATVDSIESKYFYNLLLPLPCINEQNKIIDFLTKKTLKIDTLISKIQKQIDLLNEYKQSLITSAVTGKIDVRNVQ